MKLSELIKKHGINVVSEQTNISTDNLTKLVNGDFEDLNRVRALGFASILKREYNEEMEGLASSIKEYFKEEILEIDKPVLVVVNKDNKSSGLFKWLIIFAILGGVWYLYNSGKLDGVFAKDTDDKEMILDDTKALKSNVNEDAALKEIVISGDKEKAAKLEAAKIAEMNKIAEGAMDDKTMEILATEANGSVTNISTTSGDDLDSLAKKVDSEGVNGATVATATEDPTSETATEIFLDKKINSEESVTPEVVEEVEEEKAKIIYNVTINPTRGMLWYGFISLDSKAKKEFMRKVSTPFELNGKRWILVTGHGFVDIVSDIATIEVADRKKHYFYIDSTEIREISRKEFRSLNGGHGWI